METRIERTNRIIGVELPLKCQQLQDAWKRQDQEAIKSEIINMGTLLIVLEDHVIHNRDSGPQD